MRERFIIFLIGLLGFNSLVKAQQAYFIDGYHGGVYGHYPMGQTSFIVQKLKQYPDWRVNLEIEPESWEVVRQRDPEGYSAFKQMFKDQSVRSGRIEYVNPTYAQSYFFGTSGESVIRQFQYGMRLLRKHFPEAVFTTYSAEEPCFTSCLPMVLKSLGFSYASTKNPNTMWGGYVSAYGGELVNWVGPDGTKLVTVPRYGCEDLQPGSTWQSIAWFNSRDYIGKCLDAGIKHPVGMCIQDAAWSHGWNKGPWLGQDTAAYYCPTAYKTWRDYIQNCSNGSTGDDWHFSQEDVLCSLMWGTQVMQRLAREIRTAENTIVQAEKMASYAKLYRGEKWPMDSIDEAWRTLMLSQHHDCWIVPYNRLNGGKTWAETVTDWTRNTNQKSQRVIDQSLKLMAGQRRGNKIRVFNTLAVEREEPVSVEVPSSWKGKDWIAVDNRGGESPTQWIDEGEVTKLLFRAKVPSTGFATYTFQESTSRAKATFCFERMHDGRCRLESDLYSLVLSPSKGGAVESLKVRFLQDRELVDWGNGRSFNELRGFFIEKNSFLSSTEQPATIRLMEQGPLLMKVCVQGKIGVHPFVQTIQLAQGEPRIDMHIKIDWMGDVQIGEPGIEFKTEDPRKSFYDDRYKLLLYFPTEIESPLIYKDAPFDVCKSRLENTFFNRWDSIKHNVIVHWVDKVAGDNSCGLTLFSDHTTSYVHGEDFPLALNVQYAGKGLWGMDYRIDRPTEFSYSILPHQGNWEQCRLWTRSEERNEPLIATLAGDISLTSASFLSVENDAYELSSMYYEGKSLYVRLFNSLSNDTSRKIAITGTNLSVKLVELDGRTIETLLVHEENGKSYLDLAIPQFGIRTLKIDSNEK